MARPNKQLPKRSVDIYCTKCRVRLLKYRKGGKGNLVKCFKERITEDFTTEEGVCPNCGSQFARNTSIRGIPALKIIGGKAK